MILSPIEFNMLRSFLGSLFIAAVLLLPSSAYTQSATVRGSVFDSATHEALEGVRVSIKNTKLGAIAKEDGRFNIPNVPPGHHTLTATSYGHETRTVTLEVMQTSDTVDIVF